MFFKLFVCGLIFHVCALVFPASSASCFLLSVCPSVRLSVRSSGLSFTKVVNTLCWKRMNRFWYTLVQVGKGIKRSTLGVRRSKVKVKQGRRFGGLTETSFSTMVSSLFTICVVFTIRLCTYYAFCSFHMYLWCFNKITDIMTILFVFVDIFVSPCAILFFTCSVPRIICQPFDFLQIFLRFQC